MNTPDLPISFLSSNKEAPAYWQEDILWIIHATSEQTGGAYSLMEELCPQNSGPPPHYHDQDEGFYLIEGEITFVADDRLLEAKEGFFMSIPRSTVHSFRVDSDVARVLNLYTPGGFEQTVLELGQPAKSRTLPPPGIDKQPSPEQIEELFQRIGMHVVDMPDSLRS